MQNAFCSKNENYLKNGLETIQFILFRKRHSPLKITEFTISRKCICFYDIFFSSFIGFLVHLLAIFGSNVQISDILYRLPGLLPRMSNVQNLLHVGKHRRSMHGHVPIVRRRRRIWIRSINRMIMT